MGPKNGSPRSVLSRVLARCRELSRAGQHTEIVREVERVLADVAGDDYARAELLVWQAQALLELGHVRQAGIAGRDSWRIRATPQACHLYATALAEQGRLDDAEELISLGLEMFADVPYLRIQLATLLIDQDRHDEALTTIHKIDLEGPDLDGGFAEFLWGMKADLLTALGRWDDAEGVLGRAQELFPDSDVLRIVEDLFQTARRRERGRRQLTNAWRRELPDLADVDDVVEEAIPRIGNVLDLPELGVLAARRLWRAFRDESAVCPQATTAWAAAVVAVALEVDEYEVSSASLARKTGANPRTIAAARRRLQRFLGRLDDELARRAFAAETNPRLESMETPRPTDRSRNGLVIPFPGTDSAGG